MTNKKRILIADPSTTLLDAIITAKEAEDYEITAVKTGPTCIKKVNEIKPHLAIIDLMTPHIHGIEILKIIKTKYQTLSIGVIITSYHVMIQNYHAAIEEGADYFLVKPFLPSQLFELIHRYFLGTLKPEPFTIKSGAIIKQTSCYHPIASTLKSYIRFWGTRGSNAVSGADYVRYGGNTSCLEISHNQQTIIIDAGTGIREFGNAFHVEGTHPIHLFLSHTHWDHITGFPFFAPLYKKTCNVIVWAPVGFEKSTKELFNNMLAYAYFPVRLDEMKAQVTFKELRDKNPIAIGNIMIDCHFTNHPGPTVGFKINVAGKTIGYITDNEVLLGYYGHPNDIHPKHPFLEPHLHLIQFLKDCDLIIHEAQYFPQEYYTKTGWGHSSVPNATTFLKYTGCKKWIVTHHDPNHKDKDLQIKAQLHSDILKECDLNIDVEIAYDGLILPL